MAQRYPTDFDGIFSRVPVIHWTGAAARRHARRPCDAWAMAGSARRRSSWCTTRCWPPATPPTAWPTASSPTPPAAGSASTSTTLRCSRRGRRRLPQRRADPRGADAALAAAASTFELANGAARVPGLRRSSGENTPAAGPTGGWTAWWLGAARAGACRRCRPTASPGSTARRDPVLLCARSGARPAQLSTPSDHAARVREVSALMDSTNPDLSAFRARGGKLIDAGEHGRLRAEPVCRHRATTEVGGRSAWARAAVDGFLRLYTAPGVDHVGTGAPANVDMLAALVDWVERGKAPAGLHAGRAERQAAVRGDARAAAVRVAAGAALQGRRCRNAAASFACEP